MHPDPGGWSEVWNPENTVVTFSHNPFTESTFYLFEVVLGEDLAGNQLDVGPVPNPWTFTTVDVLHIIGADRAQFIDSPPEPQAGGPNYVMLNLTIWASGNTATLTWLNISQPSTAGDENITCVKLIEDMDGDGNWSVGDRILATTTLVGGFANFTNIKNNVFTSTPRNLLIAYDISTDAQLDLSPEIAASVVGAGVASPDLLNLTLPIESTYMWIWQDTTIQPYVMSTDPAPGAGDQPRTVKVNITFSEDMDNTTINAQNITVSGGVQARNFVFTEGNRTVTFEFDNALAYVTTYKVTLNGSAIKDIDGNPLDGNMNRIVEPWPDDDYNWTFMTELAPDTTAPESQANDLPAYSTTSMITITYGSFDPDVAGAKTSGVNDVELWYSKDGGTWTLYGTFTSSPIQFNSSATGGDGKYDFYTRAKDVANNQENAPSTPDATTIIDTTPPTASMVALPTYTTATMFTVTATAADENGIDRVVLYYRRNNGTWQPYGAPDNTSAYEWELDISKTGGNGFYEFFAMAYDKAGNARALALADASTKVDNAPPTAIGAPTGQNVPVTTNITVTFNEPVNRTQAEAAFSASPNVAGTFIWNDAGTVMTFVPNSPLAVDTEYTLMLNATGILDLAGNHMSADKNWTFRTSLASATGTTITGRVVDGGENPIEGATVTIVGTSFTAVTNANGVYTFSGVSAGSYTIRVTCPGYYTEEISVEVPDGSIVVDAPTIVLEARKGFTMAETGMIFLIILVGVGIALISVLKLLKKKPQSPPGSGSEENIGSPEGESEMPPEGPGYESPPPE
ncbi:MAG: Ig-like domain-containing protein [Thermoplasmata archaeon]